ncbi:MAG: hypothetical protein KDI67_11750, partial [Gammaproteobacteria bacterium]|nr:hypothetical protein [Gammaproteobacteria bacterium]
MPGTQRIIRLKPLHAAMQRPATHPFLAGFAGLLLLHVTAQAAEPAWDCRATADGQGWRCYQEGELAPPLDKAPTKTPVTAPTEQAPMAPEPGSPTPPAPPQSAAPSVQSTIDTSTGKPHAPAAAATPAPASAATTVNR